MNYYSAFAALRARQTAVCAVRAVFPSQSPAILRALDRDALYGVPRDWTGIYWADVCAVLERFAQRTVPVLQRYLEYYS